MNSRISRSPAVLLCLAPLLLLGADAPVGKVVYSNDFEKASMGKLGDEFLVVGGNFVITEAGGNKYLELPGAPLDYFGLLFGPAEHAELKVSARIWSDKTGERLPEFGIGTSDVGGPRLWMVPAQKRVQIRKGDDVLATADCPWIPGSWTELKITVTKSAAGGATISGVVTAADEKTPPVKIGCEDKEAPSAGHGSVWGAPFSDQPIRFDDLKITTAELSK